MKYFKLFYISMTKFFFNIFDNIYFLINWYSSFLGLLTPCPHTSDVLVNVLMECLLDWKIDRKFSTLTLDNCTTNDAMIEILTEKLSDSSLLLGGDFFYMCCCDHILNLIVKEGLDVISNNVERIHNSVAYLLIAKLGGILPI